MRDEPLTAGAKARTILRILLGAFYAVAGYFHLAAPDPFISIVPVWVPAPEATVFLTGIAEIAGAAALLQPWSRQMRQAGGIGLALYALCVWPANFQHMELDLARPGQGWGLAYHVPRLLFQPVLIWLALWTGEAADWRPARRMRSR